MERNVVVVCSVAGLLGLLSAVAGFAAEATKIKGYQVEFIPPSECVYPRSPALGLGLTAAAALMIAQIIVNVASGCICCRKGPHQSSAKWTLALVCFSVSWFVSVIAFLLLLTGAALNERHGDDNMYFGNHYCYVVKPGVFAGAAYLSLAGVALGIVYYLTLTSAKKGNDQVGPPVAPSSQGGIVMGQSQVPTSAVLGAVFVHEDTYRRRQLV
ncbi:unnamed protein product [Cuscuta europaea]|uniref:Uncharacterized protein n=1 Tax=Cuscuta europaea TaxID=41803 RepID=A0A9P1E0T4_CUSEU|nr:unnamed protein product [Cuscuta europaea]